MTRRDEVLGLAGKVETEKISGIDQQKIWIVLGKPNTIILNKALNGDLTSAQKLHEELLPGWWVDQFQQHSDNWRIWVRRKSPSIEVFVKAKTPAAAWTASILRALASMEKDDAE